MNSSRNGNITDTGEMVATADEFVNTKKKKRNIEDGISTLIPFPLVHRKPLIMVTLGTYYIKASKIRSKMEVGF